MWELTKTKNKKNTPYPKLREKEIKFMVTRGQLDKGGQMIQFPVIRY